MNKDSGSVVLWK